MRRHWMQDAWLQYQQRGILQRNKRDLARFGCLQGELTPMECPLIPPTYTSSAPLNPQLLVGVSASEHHPQCRWRLAEGGSPAAAPWQPPLCILSYLFSRTLASALRQMLSLSQSQPPGQELEGFTCFMRSGHCLSFPPLSFC